jgi:predicted DCC family thiol-disulfide oxidoreductase YuxK
MASDDGDDGGDDAGRGGNPIIFFDGVCGLCDRLVQFVLRRDRRGTFHFAALQTGFAAATLRRFDRDPADLDTMYVLESRGTDHASDDARLLRKGRAILFVLRGLGGPWRVLAAAAGILPTAVLDFFYDRVAKTRYRLFGKRESCRLPSADERSRFVG